MCRHMACCVASGVAGIPQLCPTLSSTLSSTLSHMLSGELGMIQSQFDDTRSTSQRFKNRPRGEVG